MSRSGSHFIDDVVVNYLRAQIETGHAYPTKVALQRLCGLYRSGLKIRPQFRIGAEQSIVGLLYTQATDEKVRRWALNALARLGREESCIEAVKHALIRFRHEPQTTASALATIFRISKEPAKILKVTDFDQAMLALAALQHLDAAKIDLSSLPINVEDASPDILKLALVVVGLDRAPFNLLHPRHTNSQIVKALGRHHDQVVSQYSVWAITENEHLGLKDLGIDIRDIEAQPPNVRAWMLRLIAMTPENIVGHIEYIRLGAADRVTEARAGLAQGLKDTYVDGLDGLITDWYTDEDDLDVSHHLLDHMVAQNAQSASYVEMIDVIYGKEAPDSALRQRIEASARGTPLYPKLMKIKYNGQDDLFNERGKMSQTIFNFGDGTQIGSVAVGGDSSSSGNLTQHFDAKKIEAIQSQLSIAERHLVESAIPEALKAEALECVRAAKLDPAPGKLSRVVSVLKRIASGVKDVVIPAAELAAVAIEIGKLTGVAL